MTQHSFIKRVFGFFYRHYCHMKLSHLQKKDLKKFVREQYKIVFKHYPDLDNPKTFNEKIQWLKLYWYDPLAEQCSDKYAVREFVRNEVGEKYLNDIYGVWNTPKDINFDELPDEFVLKSTHASGQIIICRDKSELDRNKAIREMEKWLKTDYYAMTGEWVYKNIPRKIICEKLIKTIDKLPPKDYKIFCFYGEPKFLFVASDRVNHQTKFDFYSCDWEWLPIQQHYPNKGDILPRPKELEEVLAVSKKISNKFPQVRVDFYIENGKIIVGELTFFHFGGITPFETEKYDKILGAYLKLPPPQK